MPNAWITHLKAFRAKNKGMSLSTAMKEAKKTYKKKAPGATKVKKVKASAKAPKSKAKAKVSKARGAPVNRKEAIKKGEVKRQSRSRKKRFNY